MLPEEVVHILTRQLWELSEAGQAALTWHNAGCCVIPIRADGTKRPLGEWKQYMTNRPTRDETASLFHQRPRLGVGIVCGAVSGNLEMLELEGRAASGDDIDKIYAECEKLGTHVVLLFEELMTQGYAEWTPSGGLHFLYRILDHPVPGNTKVARRPATEDEIREQLALGVAPERINKIKVLSETRGEGGFVVVAPTPGHCHPSGESWSVAAGNIGVIPTLTWADRNLLHQAIHAALDEMPQQTAVAPRPALSTLLPSRSDRPGDDFSNRASWDEILTPHGWRVHHVAGHTTFWTRPGKELRDGHSATTGHSPTGDRLYVFTSSTEFDQETPYNKFAAYTILEHGGDFAAATRALAAAGYGAQKPAAAPQPVLGTLEPLPAAKPSEAAVAVVADTPAWTKEWPQPRAPERVFQLHSPTYTAAAPTWAEIFQDTFKYCGELKKWFYFNGTVWRPDNKDRHEQAVMWMLQRAEQAAAAAGEAGKEQLKWVRKMGQGSGPTLSRWARSHELIGIERADLDRRRHLIALGNGTYDLDTHDYVEGHNPKDLITKQVRVDYDKDAVAPRWNKMLADALPDAEVRGYLQRAAGHALLGDAQERAMFLLQGDPGTGKSQIAKVLELLFGDFAETAQVTTFNETSKRATITNDLNDLRGKRFVLVSELDEGERLNEALVKRLTGGDTAKSRGLYQENSQWQVEFTLWMVTNHEPIINADDTAMWKRVKLIRFKNVVAEAGKEIKKLGEKIFAEEAAGILNWLLEGVRLYQEHGLDDLPQITEAVQEYRHKIDNVSQFIEAAAADDTITVDTHATIGVRQLHGVYMSWCESNKIRWLGERRFAQRLEGLGFVRQRSAAAKTWQGIGPGRHGMLGTMRI